MQRFLPQTSSKHISRLMLTPLLWMMDGVWHGPRPSACAPPPRASATRPGSNHPCGATQSVGSRRAKPSPAAGTLLPAWASSGVCSQLHSSVSHFTVHVSVAIWEPSMLQCSGMVMLLQHHLWSPLVPCWESSSGRFLSFNAVFLKNTCALCAVTIPREVLCPEDTSYQTLLLNKAFSMPSQRWPRSHEEAQPHQSQQREAGPWALQHRLLLRRGWSAPAGRSEE